MCKVWPAVCLLQTPCCNPCPALPCPALLLLCRLLVSCSYLLVASQTNGCSALVVLVVYEQQDHVQHAECSRHIVATLALLFAGHLQPSGACFVLD